ncbi:MAG: UDP-N-acetylmuramoyl-L-alanine--D-glutamate ligase [Plesiomonas sp.]|uniref:UDP-N-acetylmuramoyl-L-alanine--D-glutamate ligase n=1 Tax=Plesiomonas sp. TaxID=2486279 RepID=UPI003F384CD8
MARYTNKNIVIVGLGATGLSCVDFFLSQHVTPKVMDTRNAPTGLDKLPTTVKVHTGGLNQAWLLDADLIVVSPGIALARPELQAAFAAGVEIIGDVELFCREAKAPIVAITGSNGKSTVTRLVGEMANSAGLRVGVGGNIGIPALSLLEATYDLYVLELSSFQLETTHSLQAIAATVLNVTEDHMDRYRGIDEYRAAKLSIYQHAAHIIVNADDELTKPTQPVDGQLIHFGITQGQYYLSEVNSSVWLTAPIASELHAPVHSEAVLPVDDMKLVGQHNYANALAALALADAAGISRTGALHALRTFSGLEHRFQLVHEAHGIRWINDSKATNVGSTQAALHGLKVSGRLHLLLGGDGKGADFSTLQPLLQPKHIQLYCFGRDGQHLAALKSGAVLVDTLAQAMQQVVDSATSGDIVLLSPACASLDQFKNFEVRGQEFVRLAQELAQ